MEGFYFYWLFWIFWVMAFFFMKAGAERRKISNWLLCMIILSLYEITIFQLQLTTASLFLLCTVYFHIGKEKGRQAVYLFITSFIIMLVYTTFLLYELFDPVWVVFNRTFMLSGLIIITIITLQRPFIKRLISMVAGVTQGEILFAAMLNNLSLPYVAGTRSFLDMIAILIALLLGISGFKSMSIYFEQHIKHLEREKQKQS